QWIVSRILLAGARAPARDHSSEATYPEVVRGEPRARRATSPSLFGLSPSGVYTAGGVTTSAVSSYLTISPLPTDRGRPAVCFLLHFPWNRSRWALPTTLPCGVRTFLDPAVVEKPHMGRDRDLHWKGKIITWRSRELQLPKAV